ncbi:MAG: sensor histidine kinase [Candidatus Hodarchaeales archaeon]
MNYPVDIIDLIGLILIISVLLLVSLRKSLKIGGSMKWILLILIVSIIFHSFSNTLEWQGISSGLDPLEDIFETLIPWFWGFFFYSYLQRLNQQEIREKEKLVQEQKRFAELLLDLLTHDLSNQHQIILMNLQLLERFTQDDTALEYFTILENSIQNSNLFISNVKTLSQLKGNKLPKTRIKILEIVNQATKKIHEMYPKIVLNLNIQGGDLFIKGHQLLEVVFLNLISNSIRYRKNEEKTVNVTVQCERHSNKVKICFLDKGIGISDELKSEVFDRLTWKHKDRRGSGLGLSISKRIVGMLDGNIQIGNLPDSPNDHTSGTQVCIELDSAD